MKKLALFLAILFAAVIPFGAFQSAQAANNTCRVTFYACEPYAQYMKIEPPSFLIVYRNQCIDGRPLPFYTGYIKGCEMVFVINEGEPNEQRLNYQELMKLPISSDMSVGVSLAGPAENIHVITYKTKADYPKFQLSGDEHDYNEVQVLYTDGYVLSEHDLPDISIYYYDVFIGPDENYNMVWDTDPIGYAVHGDKTFTVEFRSTGLYNVNFMSVGYSVIKSYENVPRGLSVEPPEIEEVNEFGVFVGWETDAYKKVEKNLLIFEKRADVGDVNKDSSINTGDSVMILRSNINLTTLDRTETLLADVNRDGAVNTGDAAIILSMLLDD